MKTSIALTLLALGFFYAPATYATTITFGSGANTFDIEFVDIRNPDNPDDATGSPNPAGKVEYAYRMGKFEISRDMITKANAEGGLGITMDPLSFVTGGVRDDMPAVGVSWFEAATFVNWLNDLKGASPAYKFNGGTFELWQPGDAGYNSNNRFRNSQAVYFLPSTDEWYKAAYYDASAGVYYNYPTGSDTVPTAVASGTAANTAVYIQPSEQGPADIMLAGGLSPYGTMAQGGNVQEWEETELDLVNNSSSSARGVRGGDYDNASNELVSTFRFGIGPSGELNDVGFRVAKVIPEPSSLLLAALTGAGLATRRRSSRQREE
jgi:formylglycine-generating enzyme required for sulfatase activity